MENQKLKLSELNRLNQENYRLAPKNHVSIIIDNIRSGLNIGSIFRTADAFRVNKIHICGISPTPPNKEILKSALGSTENVDWHYQNDVIELVKSLKSEGATILAVEQTSESKMLNEIETLSQNETYLVFGNEVDGVQQSIIDLCDGVIEIPQFGTKHSLNVAVSAGIVIWHITNNQLKQGFKL